MAPSFSIVIPTYNTGDLLRETLDSALAQDVGDLEVIVVDDGSTDASYETAKSVPGVKAFRQENAGDSAARNTGLSHAKGAFVVFLDHDDLLEPNAISAHRAAFAAQPEADMVFGSNIQITATGDYFRDNRQPVRHFSGLDVALNTTPSFSQCMYRRAALDKIGGFRPEALNAADHDLNIRLLGARKAGFCHGEMVMRYRKHQGQQTGSPAKLFKNHMRVLEQHFGPGGFLEDAAYLKRVKARWKTYYGRALPGEAVKLIRKKRLRDAARVLSVFLQTQPQSGIGALQYLPRRLFRGRP